MASRIRPGDLLDKVMSNPELRSLLFGLTVLYLLAFWVWPLILWAVHKFLKI